MRAQGLSVFVTSGCFVFLCDAVFTSPRLLLSSVPKSVSPEYPTVETNDSNTGVVYRILKRVLQCVQFTRVVEMVRFGMQHFIVVGVPEVSCLPMMLSTLDTM